MRLNIWLLCLSVVDFYFLSEMFSLPMNNNKNIYYVDNEKIVFVNYILQKKNIYKKHQSPCSVILCQITVTYVPEKQKQSTGIVITN